MAFNVSNAQIDITRTKTVSSLRRHLALGCLAEGKGQEQLHNHHQDARNVGELKNYYLLTLHFVYFSG